MHWVQGVAHNNHSQVQLFGFQGPRTYRSNPGFPSQLRSHTHLSSICKKAAVSCFRYLNPIAKGSFVYEYHYLYDVFQHVLALKGVFEKSQFPTSLNICCHHGCASSAFSCAVSQLSAFSIIASPPNRLTQACSIISRVLFVLSDAPSFQTVFFKAAPWSSPTSARCSSKRASRLLKALAISCSSDTSRRMAFACQRPIIKSGHHVRGPIPRCCKKRTGYLKTKLPLGHVAPLPLPPKGREVLKSCASLRLGAARVLARQHSLHVEVCSTPPAAESKHSKTQPWTLDARRCTHGHTPTVAPDQTWSDAS